MWDWIVFGLWVVGGVLTLCGKQVTKFSFSVCWLLLIMYLFGNAMGWQ